LTQERRKENDPVHRSAVVRETAQEMLGGHERIHDGRRGKETVRDDIDDFPRLIQLLPVLPGRHQSGPPGFRLRVRSGERGGAAARRGLHRHPD